MSKLLKIELINFMSLPNAVLEFDERGIISPVGYNDSGKSAITRALEVLWYDAYSTVQSKFITDGTASFTIRNYFSDDVVISRTKYTNGASHWEMRKANQVIYTNKLSNGTFAAAKGVPEAIRLYLNVFEDDATGEILNIRRNTNKLLGIQTTGGENYKIFNNLCQGERLATSVALANKDVNELNRSLTAKSARLLGMKDSLNELSVFDLETEKELYKLSAELKAVSDKLNMLISIVKQFNNFADKTVMAPIPNSDSIVTKLENLNKIAETYAKTQVEIAIPIPIADLEKLTMLVQLADLSKTTNAQVIDKIPTTNLHKLSMLDELKTYLDRITSTEASIALNKSALQSKQNELRTIAVQNNWRVCSNCGNIVTQED